MIASCHICLTDPLPCVTTIKRPTAEDSVILLQRLLPLYSAVVTRPWDQNKKRTRRRHRGHSVFSHGEE